MVLSERSSDNLKNLIEVWTILFREKKLYKNYRYPDREI